MRWLLDTNACIHYLNAASPALAARILQVGPDALAVSALTVGELHFGAARSKRSRANAARVEALTAEIRVEPFTAECGVLFGRLKTRCLAAGKTVADFDLGIAATAISGGYTVVSADADLRRVPGLDVEDWAVEG
jgi:tRNA(fMet)-specific endonuclease VapC